MRSADDRPRRRQDQSAGGLTVLLGPPEPRTAGSRPVWSPIVSATKDTTGLFGTSRFEFSGFHPIDNVRQIFADNDGVFPVALSTPSSTRAVARRLGPCAMPRLATAWLSTSSVGAVWLRRDHRRVDDPSAATHYSAVPAGLPRRPGQHLLPGLTPACQSIRSHPRGRVRARRDHRRGLQHRHHRLADPRAPARGRIHVPAAVLALVIGRRQREGVSPPWSFRR